MRRSVSKQQILSGIVGIGLLCLAGCFGGTSPNASFYILSSDTALNAVSSEKISVGVRPSQVPEFLDRPQIVLNDTSTKLNISEFNRWSEPVSLITQRAIIENLQRLLPNAYIATKGYDDQSFNRLVQIELIKMSGTLGKDATLSAWWSIQNNAGKTLTRARFDATLPCGKTYADYVNTQNTLWGKLSAQIASALVK